MIFSGDKAPELPYTAPSASTISVGQGQHRLLVLDDDRDMLSVLRSLCEPVGAVTAVGSPVEAWRELTRSAYDAIIIDPSAPDSPGMDLVRRLRQIPAYADVPVLVFSSREFSDEELEGQIRQNVWRKWEGHKINHPDFQRPARSMSMIGG